MNKSKFFGIKSSTISTVVAVVAFSAVLMVGGCSRDDDGDENTVNPPPVVTPPGSSIVDGGPLTFEGQIYRTVIIDGKRWMAENLNYAGSGGDAGVCYSGHNYYTGEQETSGCAKYGRLYTWSEVMNLPSSCNSGSCANQVQSPHQGICPAGWHVPSDADWTALENAVGSNAGTKLKSKTGWYTGSGYIAGTDDYGFSALPGGYGYYGYGGDFRYAGNRGHWWSATEDDVSNARHRYMYYYHSGVFWGNNSKSYQFSLRCSQD